MARVRAADTCVQSDSIKGLAQSIAKPAYRRLLTAEPALRRAVPALIIAFLFTIARNLHRDAQRRQREHVGLEAALPDRGPSVHAVVEHRTTLHRVRQMLRRVPRADRRALLMFVFREMSYAEIAATLGISAGATRTRICRAREALNHALNTVPGETP